MLPSYDCRECGSDPVRCVTEAHLRRVRSYIAASGSLPGGGDGEAESGPYCESGDLEADVCRTTEFPPHPHTPYRHTGNVSYQID